MNLQLEGAVEEQWWIGKDLPSLINLIETREEKWRCARGIENRWRNKTEGKTNEGNSIRYRWRGKRSTLFNLSPATRMKRLQGSMMDKMWSKHLLCPSHAIPFRFPQRLIRKKRIRIQSKMSGFFLIECWHATCILHYYINSLFHKLIIIQTWL